MMDHHVDVDDDYQPWSVMDHSHYLTIIIIILVIIIIIIVIIIIIIITVINPDR